MKFKIIAAIVGIFLGVVTYLGIDWLGDHKDLLDFHESRIESLQSDLSNAAVSYAENREDLLGEIRQLSGKLSISEGDTRSMVADTDKALKETVAWAERVVKVSVKPSEVLELHKELADLSRLVNDIRESTSKVRSDLDSLINIKETDAIIREAIVDEGNVTKRELIKTVSVLESFDPEPEKVQDKSCPARPIPNKGAMRILSGALRNSSISGTFPLVATFDIGYGGYAKDIEIIGSAPVTLRQAAKRYVTALQWDVDEPVSQCELKLKLDID